MTEAEHVAQVEVNARILCGSLVDANTAGVSQALLLPALISVFRDAGMIPQDLDLGSLMGMIR